LDFEDAKSLLTNGCQCVTECANMPVTQQAMDLLLESPILYSPGKASNAAGVACSGLEMAQNSAKIRWTSEEVDHRLRTTMIDIHETCLRAAEQFGAKGNYFTGANIAGFIKVANAMIDHGNV
jgi:glutamate dehydrogenase (NADP+)